MTKRRVARLDDQLSALRIEHAVEGDGGHPAKRLRHIAILEVELSAAEARLRDLLDDSS